LEWLQDIYISYFPDIESLKLNKIFKKLCYIKYSTILYYIILNTQQYYITLNIQQSCVEAFYLY